MSTTTSRIDVREIAPPQRHALIFSTFGALRPGEALELVNDHDPRPLHAQFMQRVGDGFSWTYLEQGPATWRVAIAKTAGAHANGSCCGSCGGA